MDGVSYIHLKGIRVTSINQPVNSYTAQYGLLLDGSGAQNCIFEQLEMDHIGGWGIVLGENNTNNLFLNCDLHHNADPYTTNGNPYGWSDGFESGSLTSTNNTLDGCRFWSNSDDGIDLRGADGVYLIKNCWSFWNGYKSDGTTAGGDGTGYKLGGKRSGGTTSILRTVENCLSVSNRGSGFDPQPDDADKILGVAIYNCTAYDNARDWGNGISVGGYNNTTIIKDCIAYNNHGTSPDLRSTNAVHDHNSFDLSVTVTDADFVSLNSAGIDGPRQADGSLPVLNFLKLAKGSDLIDAGVDVGQAYDGKAPDLGAFEFQSGAIAASPVYTSSVVENITPSLLEMTYDLNLNSSIIPAASAFNVLVNSTSRAVNSVLITGNKVQLTLASAVKFGDIIYVSYTKPSTNPLQTMSGGVADNIINRSVTNNCQDQNKTTNPPVIVIKNMANNYSGFVYEIDASASYDLNNNILTYKWTAPNDISISSTTSSKILFLAPIVNTSQTIQFQLNVSNGISIATKSIPINILPYKPELDMATMKNIEASSYVATDYPTNVSDRSFSTKWSAIGDNQSLLFSLIQPFKISHLEIAFLLGQKYSSYFDIYASKDSLIWDPILIQAKSCNFSGDMQVFNFPSLSTDTEYLYLKYIGHNNSSNTENVISEFRIFGTSFPNPNSGSKPKINVTIYPNPATNLLNISTDETSVVPKKVEIIDFSGNIVLQEALNSVSNNIQIPLSLTSGNYIVRLFQGNYVFFTKKLIVMN
jgi:uncharacterized repeat protein (TIGR02059 family)